jgi:hypothetical protein
VQVKKKGGELEVGFGGLEKMFPETIGAEDAEPDSKFTVFMLFGTDEVGPGETCGATSFTEPSLLELDGIM